MTSCQVPFGPHGRAGCMFTMSRAWSSGAPIISMYPAIIITSTEGSILMVFTTCSPNKFRHCSSSADGSEAHRLVWIPSFLNSGLNFTWDWVATGMPNSAAMSKNISRWIYSSFAGASPVSLWQNIHSITAGTSFSRMSSLTSLRRFLAAGSLPVENHPILSVMLSTSPAELTP